LQGELERSKAHSAELTSNIINLGLALEQANKKISKLEIEVAPDQIPLSKTFFIYKVTISS